MRGFNPCGEGIQIRQGKSKPIRFAGFYDVGALPQVHYKKPPCKPNRFFYGENMTEQNQKKEYQRKAEQAAINIKYAINKELAIRAFLNYLYLSI